MIAGRLLALSLAVFVAATIVGGGFNGLSLLGVLIVIGAIAEGIQSEGERGA
ncbi:hypothetical protein AAIB33_16370 [Microbacterium sp. AZCO]|uniref:hypothetical protein n=1 Tax=Microbacterium sp. AZCO TaxID=3142976 RepID=UPI0031F455FB